MSTLDRLYQQVILDHARERHGSGLRPAGELEAGLPDGGSHSAGHSPVLGGESRQVNPLCGDEVTVRVAVTSSGVIDDLSWVGEGCSISQAATSMLHDLALGVAVEEARELVGNYREMVRSRGQVVPDESVLGDAVAFAGVGRHANRVKCAMLGWTAFEDALFRAEATRR